MEGLTRNSVEEAPEHITAEEFERQFSEDHHLTVEGEDPILYTTIIPENPTSENWILYVGGFSQGKESYLDEIKDLAEAGRKVLFTNPTKGIAATEESDVGQANVPVTIRNKSRALAEIIKEVGIEKVDLVGHSQGAAVITTFAAEHAGIAGKLILECPAGLLEGNDSREKIMARFAHDKANNLIADPKQLFSKAGLRASQSFSKNLKQDFVFRLTEEIPGVAEVDIAPLLKEIKERDEETEVILVNANKDKVYSPERIEQTLGDDPLREYIDRWAMYESKSASHSTPVVGRAGLLRQILE